ncbi:MAG TPA: helix-turn-helix transcriptional regulator [Micromonosporaceae bacterium]
MAGTASLIVNSVVLRRYIGRRFEKFRVRRGLSREQAAEELQRSRVTIGRIEDGHESVRYPRHRRDGDARHLPGDSRRTSADAGPHRRDPKRQTQGLVA